MALGHTKLIYHDSTSLYIAIPYGSTSH